MAGQESRRTAELKSLRAELVKQLDRLDFRFHNIGPRRARAEMAYTLNVPSGGWRRNRTNDRSPSTACGRSVASRLS